MVWLVGMCCGVAQRGVVRMARYKCGDVAEVVWVVNMCKSND